MGPPSPALPPKLPSPASDDFRRRAATLFRVSWDICRAHARVCGRDEHHRHIAYSVLLLLGGAGTA